MAVPGQAPNVVYLGVHVHFADPIEYFGSSTKPPRYTNIGVKYLVGYYLIPWCFTQ